MEWARTVGKQWQEGVGHPWGCVSTVLVITPLYLLHPKKKNCLTLIFHSIKLALWYVLTMKTGFYTHEIKWRESLTSVFQLPKRKKKSEKLLRIQQKTVSSPSFYVFAIYNLKILWKWLKLLSNMIVGKYMYYIVNYKKSGSKSRNTVCSQVYKYIWKY